MKRFERLDKKCIELIELIDWTKENPDDECLHGAEDDLHLEFCAAIEDNLLTFQQIRKIAILLNTISKADYARWCA